MGVERIAKWESRLRPLITKLPGKRVVPIYSRGRLEFLSKLKNEIPEDVYTPPKSLECELWGIKFRSPIMNAAGMFKNGECYKMTALQGAGAYLGGTGTWNKRRGNEKNRIYQPFVPYPKSHAASNWLGLPNDGDKANADRASRMERIENCPVGWSVMASPDLTGEEQLEKLVQGMKLYEYAGVDFIEINESCPNTAKPEDDDLVKRLKYVKENFLDSRTISDTDRLREVPVIVKFSTDTKIEQAGFLLDLLFTLGFDGVNFGNTSTDYSKHRNSIVEGEHRLYDFFTKDKSFGVGGGISGRPLKESSLELAAKAVEYLRQGPPSYEFHVIRTGGIESSADIKESERAGISLNQWFTGYFENFAEHGNDVYRVLYEGLSGL